MFGVVPEAAVGAAGARRRAQPHPARRCGRCVVRGVRTMLIDAGIGDKDGREGPRHLRRRSRPRISITRWPRPGCRAGGHRHRARDAPALRSRRRLHGAGRERARRARAFRARGTSCGAASGRTRRTRTSGTAPATCRRTSCRSQEAGVLRAGRRRSDDHARACGCGGPAATRCTIRSCCIESGGTTAVFAADLMPTTAHLPRRRGSWATTSIPMDTLAVKKRVRAGGDRRAST